MPAKGDDVDPKIDPDAPWELKNVTFIYHRFTYAIQAGKYTQKVSWSIWDTVDGNQKSGKQLTKLREVGSWNPHDLQGFWNTSQVGIITTPRSEARGEFTRGGGRRFQVGDPLLGAVFFFFSAGGVGGSFALCICSCFFKDTGQSTGYPPWN